VEAHLPLVSQGDKDDWNRRLKALMGIDEVNEEKKKRAEAAKVRSSNTTKTSPATSHHKISALLTLTTHFAAMFAGCLKSLTRFEQASGAAAVLKMSSIARLRSDSSPQKLKAAAQQSFSGAAEAESKLEEERQRKEASAAKRREERKRLDELQRLKDEEDAEQAARRIVDSSSRIARMRLEDHQRQELSLRLQQAEEAPPSPPPPPAADPPREQSVAPARAGASSPVKKYLRNELRFVCFVCVCWVDFICSGHFVAAPCFGYSCSFMSSVYAVRLL
jgi:uncharacterized membrane protein YccC